MPSFRHLKLVQDKCRKAFSKNLLMTNTVITLCLSGTGDILQQRYEKLCRRQKEWNRKRTGLICVSGLVIGPVCHYWYIFLDRIYPGRSFSLIAKKVLVDQIVFTPVTISLFLVTMGALEGSKMRDISVDLKTKGWDLFKAEWLVWPPAQIFNFYFIPTKYRVLYDNTVSLGFDFYYSYVQFVKYRRSGRDNDNELTKPCEGVTFCCKIPEHSYRV